MGKLPPYVFSTKILCRGIMAITMAAGTTALTAGLSQASETAPPQSVEDLQSLSLDDLANLQVTSVSKRPESLSEAPAAVFVITAADIRRSGAVSLPEVLRLAPNLEVAKINAWSWSVTARGFNSPETANKLLVLIDGRSIYEPIASTVLWQQVDVALDNIDRIEVVSGPGGTLWGANAVNGVINIITKNAADTQGLYLRAASGVFKRTLTVRYGGKLGPRASYRLFADGFNTGESRAAEASTTESDAFRGLHGGFAIDGVLDHGGYTIKGEAYDNSIIEEDTDFTGYSLAGGWTHDLANGSSIAINAYMDHDVRDQPNSIKSPLYESRDTFDIDAQQSLSFGTKHQFVWGGELRSWNEDFQSFNFAQFAKPKTTISLGSIFAQDDIALRPDLKLTLGLKGEDNSYSGFAWLPNVRLAWQYRPDSLVWGAVSRAVRTPNRIERELQATGILVPSPDFQSETLTAVEAGWRTKPTAKSSLSLSAFYNMYDDLRTDQYTLPDVFPLILKNGGRGTTYGLEGWGNYDVTPAWRLSAGFNLLHKHFELKPGYNDLSSLAVQGMDPDYQAQIRSQWDVTPAIDLDVTLRTVGRIRYTPVPAYTEASVHVGWRVRDNIELALNASNLLHARHLEMWDPDTTPARYVGRSILVSVIYGY